MTNQTSNGRPRLVIGFMAGTSLDAVDAALLRITGAGRSMSAELIDARSKPIGAEGETLRCAAGGAPVRLDELLTAVHSLSERHAEMCARIIAAHGPVDLVALHGQTLAHDPPASWQAIEPWVVAQAARAPVVFDLRAADLAAGGQGAPITPLADWVMFRSDDRSRVIVNLGGFCNVTILPAGGEPASIRARDVCACNQVIDGAARAALGRPFDEDGAAALRGSVHNAAAEELSTSLEAQRAAGRSLGSGDECAQWIARWRSELSAEDLLATAAAKVGLVIGETVAGVGDVFLAGGGTRNRALVKAIERGCGRPMRLTDDLGVPASAREAAAMAVLGALCEDGVAITLPQATGVPSPAPVAGSWANRTSDNPSA